MWRVPPAAVRRRAAPVLTPLGAGVVLLTALVCLLHALCGGAGAGAGHAQAPRASAVAAADHQPDAGSHQHPASLARRPAPHAGPQHRALLTFGHAACAGTRTPQAPAGSQSGPGRRAGPPAGSALPHTVLRC